MMVQRLVEGSCELSSIQAVMTRIQGLDPDIFNTKDNDLVDTVWLNV